MDIKQEQVSQRIIYLMQALGANQKSFAELLGVTQPAVSKYLKDRIPPPLELLKLARATGTTIEWILCGQAGVKKTLVAEPEPSYTANSVLAEKLSSLPIDLHAHIMALIDSILVNLKEK